MNGGYVLIDAAGVNLTASSETTIDGIYNNVFRAMSVNKPIVLYNVLNGSEDTELLTPLGCVASLSAGTITVNTYIGKTFTITSADVVTITA